MARMVTLEDWAKDEFGDESPGPGTLRVYAKARMMAPPAVKVGRRWMIDREARYTGILAEPKIGPNANPRLRRIIEDGSKTANP